MKVKRFRQSSRFIAGIVLGVALFFTSLLISATRTQTITIGAPGAQCGKCGTYNTRIALRGWPMAAHKNDINGVSLSSSQYESDGWQSSGVIADLTFWILLSEIIMFII